MQPVAELSAGQQRSAADLDAAESAASASAEQRKLKPLDI